MKKKPRNLLGICLLALTGAVFAQSNAADTTPSQHQRLKQQLADYVYAQAQDTYGDPNGDTQFRVEAAGIDPRIDVPICAEPYSFDVEMQAMEKPHFSVRVGCDSQNWFTYSTVRLVFTQDIVVTNGTLTPNTMLTADHLRIEKVDAKNVRFTGFEDKNQVVGAKLKYRVRPGQPVTRSMLCYVCKGDRITIAAKVGGMRVKTTGIAQEDGTLGQTIEIMNVRSKKKIFAQVASTQEVVVSL